MRHRRPPLNAQGPPSGPDRAIDSIRTLVWLMRRDTTRNDPSMKIYAPEMERPRVFLVAMFVLATCWPVEASNWTDIAGLVRTNLFGTSIQLNGNGTILVAGEPGSMTAKVWQHSGTMAWSVLGSISDTTPYSGRSVAISEDGSSVAVASKNSVIMYSWDPTMNPPWSYMLANTDGSGMTWSADLCQDSNSPAVVSMSKSGTLMACMTGTSTASLQFFERDIPFGSELRWFKYSEQALQENTQYDTSVGAPLGYHRLAVAGTTRTSAVIAVGFGWNGATGKVRTYQIVCSGGCGLSQLGDDILGNTNYVDNFFGSAVALSANGTRLVVGASVEPYRVTNAAGITCNPCGPAYARVYDFVQTGSAGGARVGSWSQVGGDIEYATSYDYANSNGQFGKAVSISDDGSIIAIGAPAMHWSTGKTFARIYMFSLSTNEWEQHGDDIEAEYVGDETGFSISLSGDGTRVAVGAPNQGGSEGYVRVYELPTSNSGSSSGSSNASAGSSGSSNAGGANNSSSGGDGSSTPSSSEDNTTAPPPPSPPPKLVLDDEDVAIRFRGWAPALIASACAIMLM